MLPTSAPSNAITNKRLLEQGKHISQNKEFQKKLKEIFSNSKRKQIETIRK
jgi:hypothetical protein